MSFPWKNNSTVFKVSVFFTWTNLTFDRLNIWFRHNCFRGEGHLLSEDLTLGSGISMNWISIKWNHNFCFKLFVRHLVDFFSVVYFSNVWSLLKAQSTQSFWWKVIIIRKFYLYMLQEHPFTWNFLTNIKEKSLEIIINHHGVYILWLLKILSIVKLVWGSNISK